MRPVRLPSDEPKRHKYGAEAQIVDGVRFASRREARRYGELKLLEKAGEIRDLELQPKFPLYVPAHHRVGVKVEVGKYTADFRYREGPNGLLKIEDVKSAGTRTTAYRLRKRMVEATYGIRITEV